ncbi:hypothetical protein SmJEL517_g02254 [Synchytrium microbalum]|uniref:Uncharacterized protein n=1 Tax=Synchytrium microbalum TaxID=1806994 RepID=A0A507C6J1_9FUNG|nr:uncharacterized protein SmJEL517_g02254 [Synchytrium microbalum]TPX35242.1 hypothetical protein SmJEL517_g02254 [Synchytrium microbalum]
MPQQNAIEESAVRMKTILDMRPLRRASKQFQKMLSTSAPDAARNNLLQFQLGVRALQIHINKHELVDEMNRQEVAEYHREESRIEREMAEVTSDIEALKTKLVEAQQLRANKLVYEELAKQALALKSRDEMVKRIAQHKRDIDELNEEARVFDVRWELRRKQYVTSVAALYDFQAMLKDTADGVVMMQTEDDPPGDEEEEEGVVDESPDKADAMMID